MTTTLRQEMISAATAAAVLVASAAAFLGVRHYLSGTWLSEFNLIGAGAGTILLMSALEALRTRLGLSSGG